MSLTYNNHLKSVLFKGCFLFIIYFLLENKIKILKMWTDFYLFIFSNWGDFYLYLFIFAVIAVMWVWGKTICLI